MRIQSIEVFQHELPIEGKPYTFAGTSLTAMDTTLVRITADDGLVGFGETCPLGPAYQPHHAGGARAALMEISPQLIGANPLHINQVNRLMDAVLMGHAYAKAAIDIALWDLAAKRYAVRVCDLLGGPANDRVPSYFAIGITGPDEAARVALEKQAEGYPRLQIKVGRPSIEEDIAVIRRVAEVIRPGVRLVADANRAWTIRDAIAVSGACRDVPMILEQPCATNAEIRELRGRVHHPIYLDETAEDVGSISAAIADGTADGFGLKVTRVGGLSPMLTIRDLCRVHNRPHTCDDAWGGDVIAAACIHIGATVDPRHNEGVWIAAPYLACGYDVDSGIAVRNGWLDIPAGPGLGVEPDVTQWGAPAASFG